MRFSDAELNELLQGLPFLHRLHLRQLPALAPGYVSVDERELGAEESGVADGESQHHEESRAPGFDDYDGIEWAASINASTIVGPRYGDEIADAVAKRLAEIVPLAADDPAARLSGFANPKVAEVINEAV